MLILRTLIISSPLLFITYHVLGASFDCEKAETRSEKLICGDSELSSMDDTLAKEYRFALGKVKNRKELISSQKKWLTESRDRDIKETKIDWIRKSHIRKLKQRYRDRIRFLASIRLSDASINRYLGTYETKDRGTCFVNDPETGEYTGYCTVTNTFSISRESDNNFKISFTLYGGNLHRCEMNGVAVRDGYSLVHKYRTTKEDCYIKVEFYKDDVFLIGGESHACKQYHCGQRASYSGSVFKLKNKRN